MHQGPGYRSEASGYVDHSQLKQDGNNTKVLHWMGLRLGANRNHASV